ncbi:hypothetical protein AMJ80_04910 [bacterium SM23_31]|nr:MAG: hypothetical protein AMJ80_04910 [bacterium SM23_31]
MVTPNDLYHILKCRLDPWYFLTHFVRTLERELGERTFPDYPYLRDMVRHFQKDRRMVVLKSRQMLVTWTAVAFALWEAIFRGNADILFISKREDDAREAIRRIKFIYDRLPDYLKPKIGENTKYVFEFPDRQSRLMALPTSPNIGRTYSPTRIIWDEMASTPYDEDIFASLQPSLDGGGYFMGISTSQGPLTKHAELYMNAEAMGFTRIAVHYSKHPFKDEEWCKLARRGMSDERWQMEQEMSLSLGGSRVYASFQKQTHVISDWIPDYSLPFYRSIDFGFHTPVVLWAQVVRGKLIIFREWIGEDETISDMARAVIDTDSDTGLNECDFVMTFCDPAGAAQTDQGISSLERLKAEYFEATGLEMKIKYRQSSIMAGVDLVREKLRNASGEINLLVSGNCPRTIADFGRYVKKKDGDEPKKDGLAEHTMDALRYMVVNLFQKPKKAGAGILKPRVAGMVR